MECCSKTDLGMIFGRVSGGVNMPKETDSDGVLLKSRLGHDFREGVGRGQYAKSDGALLENRLGHYFREVGGRGQYAKSDGVLLQNKLPGNSQDG